MKTRLLLLFCLVLSTGLRAAPSDNKAITDTLLNQAAAWNRGDIEAFMQTYVENDQLRFASTDKIVRGWKATLERYKQRYPDKSAMGTLSFTELEITRLGSGAAIVFGRWQLVRANDTPHGLFTLTLIKSGKAWRILQDHTSSAAP